MVGSWSKQIKVNTSCKALKRAMRKANDDLKDNTKYTSLREADKHEHQLKDDNEAEACEDADC